MGLQPVVAGRFYGFSNVAFALFATGAMLFAIAVADHFVAAGPPAVGRAARRRHRCGGHDAGRRARPGAATSAARWGWCRRSPCLTLLVLGVRLSWRKVLLIGLGTVLLLAVVSVADWLRPADSQTHLGRFVQTVIDGGAWQVISRKGEQNLSILFGSVLSILVPVAAAVRGAGADAPVVHGGRRAGPGLRPQPDPAPGALLPAAAARHRLRGQRLGDGDPGRRRSPWRSR